MVGSDVLTLQQQNALNDEQLRQQAAQMRAVAVPSNVQPPATAAQPQQKSLIAPPSQAGMGMPPVVPGSTQDLENHVHMAPPATDRAAATRGVLPMQQEARANMPAVNSEDRIVNRAQQNLESAENSTPATTKLWDKAKTIGDNPDSFLGRHPMLGKIARIGGEIGAGTLRGVETAANIAAPGVMLNIPGTEFNRAVRITGAEAQLGAAEKNRSEAATNEQEKAKGTLETEQAKQLGMLGAGKSDADQLVRDMMMGGTQPGTPKINPATQQPYTLSDAMAEAHRQLKSAEATPGNTPLSQQPDLFANAKSRIDQMLPNATPEQRAVYYPTENMTAEQADKLAAQALEVSKMNSADAQRRFEQDHQKHEDSEKKQGKTVEWTENGKLMYGTQADAEARGQKWIPSKKGIDDIRHDTALLNDMQAKLNDVVSNRTALDQDGTQKTIIAKVLSTTGGGGITVAGQHIPLAPERGGALDQLIQAGMLQGASDSTVQYIQSVLSFRESALALPKMITNSGRQSEIASRALWATTPGLEPDSQYALGQARRFQGNLDRLRRGTATIVGEETNMDQPNADLVVSGGTAPEGHQVRLQNGHIGVKRGGKWIDTTTNQEVK